VLDPFGENGRWPTGHYNPLDELDPAGKEVIDEAGAIAQALVVYIATRATRTGRRRRVPFCGRSSCWC